MPFLVIIVVLVVRGRGLPLRGSITDRLPRVGTGRVRPRGLVLVALAVVWLLTSSASCADAAARTTGYVATIISVTFAIVGLSVVVLTGYTGQLSLAQFALAGIGAFTAGKLAAAHGWRFEPALLVGVLVAMAIGFLFGLPALRTRGVNLAVVTFGLGFAVFQLVFSNSAYTENARVQPTDLSFLGLPVDPVGHPRNYACSASASWSWPRWPSPTCAAAGPAGGCSPYAPTSARPPRSASTSSRPSSTRSRSRPASPGSAASCSASRTRRSSTRRSSSPAPRSACWC